MRRVRTSVVFWTFLLVTITATPASTQTSNHLDSLVTMGIEAAQDGKPRIAVEAFETVLAKAPHRIESLSAALAFQYAWSGQLGRARTEFRRATALDPENVNLRLGELLVTNWMGDHLKAWSGYNRLRRFDITNAAPLLGMAAAQNWAGRKDLSLATLEVADNLAPDHPDIMHLKGHIQASLRPQGGFFHDFAEDSDGFLVNGIKGELSFSPHTQARFRPFWNKQKIRLDDRLRLKEEWLGVGFDIQPMTRLSLWGNWAYLLTPADEVDGTPYAGSTRIDAILHDRVRLSGSFERFATVSYVTVPDKITGEVYGLHGEVRPNWRTKINVSIDRGFYNDGNDRWNFMGHATREIYLPYQMKAGILVRQIEFRHFLDNGIWTPEKYWSRAGTLDMKIGKKDVWALTGGLELGLSKEADLEQTLHAGFRLGFFKAWGPWILDASVGRSEGNLESTGGYNRTYTHLGLRMRL